MDGKITKIKSMKEFNYEDKTVILRVDINSPIDPKTKEIMNDNRIKKSIPTIEYLLRSKAKVAILAHQGDTLDYHNLISLKEHTQKLSMLLGPEIPYIDDVCGPAAQEAIKSLKPGEAVLLGNLRYLTEEVSSFEEVVKLEPKDMLQTYLVRSLAPLADYYVNDAFAAAHRNAPSMVAFQEILPTAGGLLLEKEVNEISKIMDSPTRPNVFILGGLKISDAFGMMEQVLKSGSADKILTCGVTGNIMLMAKGYNLGERNSKFIKERGLEQFIGPAKKYLEQYGDKILVPLDIAYEKDGNREEINIEDLPVNESYLDIGSKTLESYKEIIADAGTLFYNGPAGVYENLLFEKGTRELWKAIAATNGYSVIGGGDTVSAAGRFIDLDKINYVCTAGGAMVRFLSGVKMPLIEAMTKAFEKKN
ncbi:phosphoglycerate kinase [Alkalibaculum bacchi]|uniref:phosphoglycerate kinase n=1 Tax=Alkalibaculum bacchi TaxID=645887 RepID=UPI0026E996B2|nr:phosphoglycerate kinase [Alkalibaculum bacchi]